MRPVPYIDTPLPAITLRTEWQLFSSRPLPIIAARMNRNEILQIIGGDAMESTVTPAGGSPAAIPAGKIPAAAGVGPARLPTDGDATETFHTPGGAVLPSEQVRLCIENAGATRQPAHQTPSSRSATKYRKPRGQPNRPNSGGYNLETHLVDICAWTTMDFEVVQVKTFLGQGPLRLTISSRQYIGSSARNWMPQCAIAGKTRRQSGISVTRSVLLLVWSLFTHQASRSRLSTRLPEAMRVAGR